MFINEKMHNKTFVRDATRSRACAPQLSRYCRYRWPVRKASYSDNNLLENIYVYKIYIFMIFI